jgi:hypothetical protein
VLSRRRFLQAGLALGVTALWAGVAYSPRGSLQSVHEALASLRSQRRPPPPLEDRVEYRGVIHAHTEISHDSDGTVDEMLAAAEAARLNFLVTTDHYSPRIYTDGIDGFRGSLLVIRGLEIGMGCIQASGIDRRCGAVLAIGLREPLFPDEQNGWQWDALFAKLREQGALSIIAHPRGLLNPSYYQKADGMEIYDVADAMRERIVDVPRILANFAVGFGDYPEECLLPWVERMNWNLVQWDRFSRERRVIGLAGNDAHQRISIFGRTLDRYDLVFRMVNTHVLAESLTKDNIMAGLREGRCFASFNLLGDAAGFQFVARDASSGALKAVLGEELKMQDNMSLEVLSPIPASIVMVRDGMPIRREQGRAMVHVVDRPGVYRVEVSLRVVDRWRPWIFSNPIYIRA